MLSNKLKIFTLIFIFIIFGSLYTLKSFYQPYFFTSHDGIHQVVRIFYFDKAIRDGNFPPRWINQLNNNLGYPLFNFSYHLPWFIAEPFVLIGFSYFNSIKIVFILGFIISGITMFIYLNSFLNRIASFTGTVLYLYAPYRFSNIFVRAAIGDATIFIFPPLLFLSILKLSKKEKKEFWIAIGALSIAGLILSHAMVSVFFLVSSFFYFLYLNKPFYKLFDNVKNYFVLYILGIFIAGYYFFPSLFERQFTVFDSIMRPVFTGNTFLNLNELVYSSWGYGVLHASEGGMSVQIGIAQLFAVSLAFFIVISQFISKNYSKKNKDSIFFLTIFSICIFLMLPLSKSVWIIINNYILIDFTFRILALVIFVSAVLAGIVVSNINYPYFFSFFLIIISFYTNRNHLRINQILEWPIDFYRKLELTTNSFNEYTPKWLKIKNEDKNFPNYSYTHPIIFQKINHESTNILDFYLMTKDSGDLTIYKAYYPGWIAYIDNKPNKVSMDSNGLVKLSLDKGYHHIVLKFEHTPLRLISNTISIIALIVAVNLLFKKKYE